MFQRFSTTVLIALFFVSPAFALITGGKDEPMQVPGLPEGSEALANLKTRIAWWEGPPFGGGQYHFDYSGETADLQTAINLFAQVESGRKQVVVRSGRQESFWLKITDKSKNHPVDWQFVVWIPASWQRLSDAKAGLLPSGEEGGSPKTELLVFVTDRIDWDAIRVPQGLTVIDERLESNGIPLDQGGALKGTVVDAEDSPIAGAKITVGKDDNMRQGTSDQSGKFLIKKIPAGTHQIKVAAKGFASKDLHYHEFTTANVRTVHVTLAESAEVRVRVVDQNGKPLPNVELTLYHCKDRRGNDYRIARDRKFTSDAKGEFELVDVPDGKVRFGSRTKQYYYNSVLNEHDTNEDPIVLRLLPTGSVKVSVFSPDGQPVTTKYVVEINEKGVDLIKGGGVGTWGGSANIGADGTHTFENVPPGDYVVTGKPNPGRTDDRTDPQAIKIKGTDRHEIKLIR